MDGKAVMSKLSPLEIWKQDPFVWSILSILFVLCSQYILPSSARSVNNLKASLPISLYSRGSVEIVGKIGVVCSAQICYVGQRKVV